MIREKFSKKIKNDRNEIFKRLETPFYRGQMIWWRHFKILSEKLEWILFLRFMIPGVTYSIKPACMYICENRFRSVFRL